MSTVDDLKIAIEKLIFHDHIYFPGHVHPSCYPFSWDVKQTWAPPFSRDVIQEWTLQFSRDVIREMWSTTTNVHRRFRETCLARRDLKMCTAVFTRRE